MCVTSPSPLLLTHSFHPFLHSPSYLFPTKLHLLLLSPSIISYSFLSSFLPSFLSSLCPLWFAPVSLFPSCTHYFSLPFSCLLLFLFFPSILSSPNPSFTIFLSIYSVIPSSFPLSLLFLSIHRFLNFHPSLLLPLTSSPFHFTFSSVPYLAFFLCSIVLLSSSPLRSPSSLLHLRERVWAIMNFQCV